ncbi:MAG: hypothetical protein QXO84_00075 [Candidatus Aenigmatarchaeota archaeon]
MKGVSNAIIVSLIFLIVVMLFLVLSFTIFKSKTEPLIEYIRNTFKEALRLRK